MDISRYVEANSPLPPLAAPIPEGSAGAEALPVPPSAPVLVVDDDELARDLLATQLRSLGYATVAVGCAEAARGVLGSQRLALVITDHDMPGGSGLDLLTHVAEVHPSVPVILLTGRDETPLARAAIRSGALDFLAKPYQLSQLARAIEQCFARLERDRRRVMELTNDLLRGTVRSLVAAVDAKDPYTASHSDRVCRLALRLGETLGLPAERMLVLEMAALLHDVGKIGVPEAVLRKPGRLDPGEWALIRSHPVRSAEIVGQVGAMGEIAGIVRHHHERVDGSGYPDGLSGSSIHEFARILALADSYEAMTSHRAYRPALAPEVARQQVHAGRGSQFDAELADAFLHIPALP